MLSGSTITFGGKTLNRINTPSYASEYLYTDAVEEYRLFVRHSKTTLGQHRHNVEVIHTTWGATSEDPDVVRKCYFVMQHDATDGVAAIALMDNLADVAIATSDELLTDLVGWEV
jgi:hypothetical protein